MSIVTVVMNDVDGGKGGEYAPGKPLRRIDMTTRSDISGIHEYKAGRGRERYDRR